jgi:hypothetical protein
MSGSDSYLSVHGLGKEAVTSSTTFGHAALPAPMPMRWNRFDACLPTVGDGVVAINRLFLARYFQNKLLDYVEKNCFSARVRVWMGESGDQDCHWEWKLTPRQTPIVAFPPSGSTVLTFSNQSYAHDEAGHGGEIGQMTLSPAYILNVQFDGNTIVVNQHLLVYLRVQAGQTSESGNVVDKLLTDTFTLSVDGTGQLQAVRTSGLIDNSSRPSEDGFLDFFPGLNDIIGDVEGWVENFASTDLAGLPLSLGHPYCFPGGPGFRFLDVGFSTNQDLVAHIAYKS